MPMSHKSKKSKKNSKKPKLSTKTGWNIYSQHYLAEMQPEAFALFEKFDKEEEINSQNLENWRNAYADEKNNFLLSAEDFVVKVKEYGPDSPETNIKKFKKPELIHLLGCVGLASEVTQCSKIGDLRASLVAYYKGCN